MRIFVTLGTQKQPFTRILTYLENMNMKAKIVVQNGNTSFESKKMKFLHFITREEMQKEIKKSDLIVTHGGGGSIFEALELSKKVICVPRRKKYKEHINDHQLEIVEYLAKKKYIILCETEQELEEAIHNIDKISLKKYEPHPDQFVKKIEKVIDEVLEMR